MALDYELQSRKLLILFTSVRRWYLSKAVITSRPHQYFKLTYCNFFEFNHRGVLSCHTLNTQSVVQVDIITIDVCLNMQSNFMGSLLGA